MECPSGANDLVNKTYVDAQVSAGLPNVGTAGTYAKVTTDTKGRVTSGGALVEADIPTLSTAGKVSGDSINAGTIGGSTAINSSGNLVTTGTVQGAIVRATNLRVFNGANYVQLAAPALGGNLNFSLPAADGGAGALMKTNGAGQLSFGTLGATDIPSLDTTKITTGTLPVGRGGTGQASYGSNSVVVSNLAGNGFSSLNCASGKVLKFDVSGFAVCGDDATGAGSQWTTTGSDIYFNTGKVGIGTATPVSKLEVDDLTIGLAASFEQQKVTGNSTGILSEAIGIGGTSNTGGYFSASGAAANRAIYIPIATTAGANNYAIYSVSPAQSYFAGNVGIGTTTPSGLLDVKGTIKISGATSGAVGFAVPATAGSAIYTWPAAAPASNKLLQSDAAGTLSWVSAGGGGDALVANPLSQFAATTSAQLSGVLSDETGFGAAVFASSPTLAGTPLAPTAAANTNTTQIATTAFVLGQASSTGPVMDGTQTIGISTRFSREDHVHPSDTSRAPAAGSASIITLGTISTGTWNGTTIAVANGGTGAITPLAARTNLGLGTSATVNTGNSSGLIPTLGATGIGANLMCTGDGTGVSIICNTSIPTGNALTTNPLSQFAATTSAQLAGVLNDETGSGAAVFGTAPTFTTNITSPLVIGGTGTTSTLTYKTTTGVGAAGADHVFLVGNNGGTQAMRILNNGNVGIGTSNPVDFLSFGPAVFDSTRATINLSNTALVSGSSNGTYIGANPGAAGADFINYQVSSTSKFKVDSGGAVSASNMVWNSAAQSLNFAGVTSPTGDALIVGASPAFSAAASLIRLGPNSLSFGSANGTYIGANPGAAGADFINYQVSSTSKFKVDSGGALSATNMVWNSGAQSLNFAGITLPTGDALIVGASPPFLATASLIRLGANSLSGGSMNGTYIGANPGAANADFINYQVSSTSKFKVDSGGAVSASNMVWNSVAQSLNFAGITAPTGDGLIVGASPPSLATASLIRLGANSLSGGSMNGTYIGANPGAANADFINYQVSNTSKFRVDSGGALSATNMVWNSVAQSLNFAGITAPTGDGLIVGASPPFLATASLVRLGANSLSGGSMNGTYIGANPGAAMADFINYQVSNTSKFKVDSEGKVGVGNTSPNYLLHVGSSSVGTGLAVATFQNIDGACTITPAASGSGIACSSDERLKENFQDVTGAFALDRILQLQAVTYNFKTSSADIRRTGYKAQEVQKIAPEFVRQNEDGMLQVYYDAFIPWITEAIKTLHHRMTNIANHQGVQDRQIASKAEKNEIEQLKAENAAKDKKIIQLEKEAASINERLEKIERALNSKNLESTRELKSSKR
jgi:hypothetical protein